MVSVSVATEGVSGRDIGILCLGEAGIKEGGFVLFLIVKTLQAGCCKGTPTGGEGLFVFVDGGLVVDGFEGGLWVGGRLSMREG